MKVETLNILKELIKTPTKKIVKHWNKKIKFIPLDDKTQVMNHQRTNKKSTYKRKEFKFKKS